MSRLDQVYRRLILTKFFTKGWGQPENLRRLFNFRKIISNREVCQHLVPDDYPITIDKERVEKDMIIQEGHFRSPFTKELPGIMPKEVETAKFEVILPRQWKTKLKPVVIHLAGTGDHNFGRRRMLLAKPLLKEAGIASIILENPYYGYRKPKQQTLSALLNVSDLFVMGGALVLESMALLHWCEKQGYGPLGLTGISMGGHMASLAATNWKNPISLIPCLSWSTASSVFTQGVMSGAIPWKLLEKQYLSDTVYEDKLTKMIVSPENTRFNPSFVLGQQFSKHYPESINDMISYQEENYQGINDNNPNNEFISEYRNGNDSQTSERNPDGSQEDNTSECTQFQGMGKINSGNGRNAGYHTTSSRNAGRDNGDNKEKSQLSRFRSLNIFDLKWPEILTQSLQFRKAERKSMPFQIQEDALDFMKGIMDECTHLGNFSRPVDCGLIILVQAKQDAYVPRDKVLSLQDLWPGAEVRYIDTGHIGAFLTKQPVFRKAITDSLEKQALKYYGVSIFEKH